jgi:hypothetical protein
MLDLSPSRLRRFGWPSHSSRSWRGCWPRRPSSIGPRLGRAAGLDRNGRSVSAVPLGFCAFLAVGDVRAELASVQPITALSGLI